MSTNCSDHNSGTSHFQDMSNKESQCSNDPYLLYHNKTTFQNLTLKNNRQIQTFPHCCTTLTINVGQVYAKWYQHVLSNHNYKPIKLTGSQFIDVKMTANISFCHDNMEVKISPLHNQITMNFIRPTCPYSKLNFI